MSALVIVDTDILIDAGMGIEEAIHCLQQGKSHAQFAVSAITKMELIVGCRNKHELQHNETFLRQFEIIALNEAISHQAEQLLQQYRLSHGLLIADALIAATAVVVRCPFISKNQRDYRFIAELDLLPYPRT